MQWLKILAPNLLASWKFAKSACWQRVVATQFPMKQPITKKFPVVASLLLDLSSIHQEINGGTKFWCMIQDEATKMKWSFFLKSKSDMAAKIVPFLIALKKQHYIDVKFIRLD